MNLLIRSQKFIRKQLVVLSTRYIVFTIPISSLHIPIETHRNQVVWFIKWFMDQVAIGGWRVIFMSEEPTKTSPEVKPGSTIQTELGPCVVLQVEGNEALVMGPFGIYVVNIDNP